MDDRLPEIRPFVAERSLGQGGVGQVYLASQNGTRLAIKVIHPEIATNPVVAAILENARTLSHIHHPNLVSIGEAGELEDGRPFISMEYLDGVDLGQVLAREQALDFARVVGIARQLCAGLSALHAADLCHLDLKPANVLLLEGDRIKILDLGLAGTDIANLDLGPGSPEYWSPEHARGAVDERSDIYSAGVLLYEALTGTTPFSSHSVAEVIAQHLHAEPSRLSPPPSHPPIPEQLQEVVLRCLRKDPEQRYQTAAELGAALDAINTQLLSPRSVDGSSTWSAAGARARRSRAWSIGATLLVVAAATGVGLLLAHRRGVPALASVQVPDEVEITVTSIPAGAFVYRRGGGELLARTPATLKLSKSHDPLGLVLRFPSGKKTEISVIPDRAAHVHGVEPEAEP